MRLQKFMASCAVASRRKSEQMILDGRVSVNGKVITVLGSIVDPDKDEVVVDGNTIKPQSKKLYIMLNKPSGYVTSVSDEFNRPTVMDIIKRDLDKRIYPIGRLDYQTEGLLLLTNDGDFNYAITHPKHEIDKVYIALVSGVPHNDAVSKLEKGVDLDGVTTAPCNVQILKIQNGNAILKITLHEGKNRQIRKMCECVGHNVIHLKRVSIGKINLGNLPLGKWRHLKPAEVNQVRSQLGMAIVKV